MMFCDKVCGIYCIENINTHKKYIGQSQNIHKRWLDHKWALNNNVHDNSYLQKAWNKYGEENFSFIVIEECMAEDLNDREIYYIDFFKSFDRGYGYNLRGGGGQLANMTKDLKEKFGGKNNPMYGKNHTEEARQKISDARKNLYSGKNHPRCRSVYCIELDMLFWGAKEAQDVLGVSRGNIAKCCSGKLQFAGKHPDTGERFHWLYIEDAIKNGYCVDNISDVKGVI